jgi:hypothetical protein
MKVLSFTLRENSSLNWLSFPGAGQPQSHERDSLMTGDIHDLGHFLQTRTLRSIRSSEQRDGGSLGSAIGITLYRNSFDRLMIFGKSPL